MTPDLKAPFPYFGGKATVADIAWRHFGDVTNYVEPFAGSLAVLLLRPEPQGIETVNDLDGMVANFWRALAADPDAVAHHADWPVNELDLHARHRWLVEKGLPIVERLREDPDFCDPKIAGWWVWGISQWIGSGWCESIANQLPHLSAGMGVHRASMANQRPHLGNAGMGVHRASIDGLQDYFRALSARLRRVRVCCGDWSRVCGPTPTTHHGTTAVFLDPPYDRKERDANIYAKESDCATDVRAWCHANGHNRDLRIILCGYAGEGHESLEAEGWRVIHWKAQGGYARTGNNRGKDNAHRERLWLSPHCVFERSLFEGLPHD